MKSEEIFAQGLGLSDPWDVVEVKFEQEKGSCRSLHIYIDFRRGSKFMNDAGELVTAYDTVEKQWRHLNFFEHKCILHCRVPRIRLKGGGIRMVEVPWARPNSGFTLLFEAFAMKLVEGEMPISSASKQMKVSAPCIWRIFHYWVRKARKKIDLSNVSRIGVDETSSRKGHNYITSFVDLDTRQLIFVTEGKGEEGFMDVFTGNMTPNEAINYLEKWCKAVMNTTLRFMKKFVATLKAHWTGIINTFTHPGVNNGILEGLNLKIQLAKRRARGFLTSSLFLPSDSGCLLSAI